MTYLTVSNKKKSKHLITEISKTQGEVSWRSPSNIALVKYWGKYGRQLPSNPSISLTLSQAHTNTSIKYKYAEEARHQIAIDFKFEGAPQPLFQSKIEKFLTSIQDVYPLISHLDLSIESDNSFPHSSGIASSASSMSALAICLLDIEREIKGLDQIDLQRASLISRLGSGSACRSVFGPIAIWGDTDFCESSNEFAIPYHELIDPIFHDYVDDIFIISAKEKSVSSRAGHALMNDNPYAAARFEQASNHLKEIVEAMKQGDTEKFGSIVEKEALTLHALMMASEPPYILMEANTINAIREIQQFRAEKNIPVYFTLDAGPNIHLLYPSKNASDIIPLKEELRQFCEDGRVIEDKTGSGPTKLI